MADFYIILTGFLVAASCGILGCLLILRKMAMVGDAISHAILPGIVIAFLFTGSRESFTMIIGAGTIGVLTTLLIEFLNKKGKLQSDASIGISFTWLFALGVILISAFTSQVDLDQECVLYGEIAYVPLNQITLASGITLGPLAVYQHLILLGIIILITALFFKEFKITSFDPSYALTIGISASLWNYVLMGMVSFTTVVSFEAVGAILVVAFLITPAATAYLLSRKLKTMMLFSVLFGFLASLSGYYVAYLLNASIAGSMAMCSGIIFAVVFLIKQLKTKAKTHIVKSESMKVDIR